MQNLTLLVLIIILTDRPPWLQVMIFVFPTMYVITLIIMYLPG